jgi:hypothetical protein
MIIKKGRITTINAMTAIKLKVLFMILNKKLLTKFKSFYSFLNEYFICKPFKNKQLMKKDNVRDAYDLRVGNNILRHRWW